MDIFDIEIKVKTYLNQNKIRLCDEPYTVNDEKGYGLKELAEVISKEINEVTHIIENALEELRNKAIINIKCISKFTEKKISSIKIYKLGSRSEILIEIENIIAETGLSFKGKVCQVLNISGNFMKMIFKGKLIADNDLLCNIGIKNNSKIMILNVTESHSQPDILLPLNQGRQIAEYLSERAIDGKFQSNLMNLEITNQSGEVLQLTNDQKRHITFGLTMHKQATNFILSGNFQVALLHCLEADEAFTASNYCDQVDNVAILQLDIVWCYFCLQNIDDIIESKRRLEICETRMKKCYGEGNERIQRIREKTTFEGVPEGVHVFRLYLMKGILAYYENDNGNAICHLNKALDFYNSLSVPDELIAEVMQLGFTKEQAIDGLRVNKNVNIAVEYILRRIEDVRVLEARNEDLLRRDKVVRRLGFTDDESRIDLSVLELLIEQSHMAPSLCLAAIRRTNNRYEEALDMVFNHEETLSRDVQLARHKGLVHDGDTSYEAVVREKSAVNHLTQLVHQDKDTIRRCLRQCDGNVDGAMNILLDDTFAAAMQSTRRGSRSSSKSRDRSEESQRAQLEDAIYNDIGPGSTQQHDQRYSSRDLLNEITAFNKFAGLLSMPLLITSATEDVQWN